MEPNESELGMFVVRIQVLLQLILDKSDAFSTYM
jgi:hypothetical protein